jgi:hypothetical protein
MEQKTLISVNADQISKAPLGGFNKFASDVQWMLLINYAGGLENIEKAESDEIYKRLNDILANDPDLEIAYNMGGMMLTHSDPVKCAEIFVRGANNPNLKNSWQIPFSAGFVLDRYVTDKDDPDRLKKAEEMFRLAASRTTEDATNINSALLRVRAKRIAKNGNWNGIPIANDEHALLCTIFDEWRKSGGTSDDNSNKMPGETKISDLKDRLLRAAKNAKESDPTNKNILETIAKVVKLASEDQHLCTGCLTSYAGGEKFCSQCGTAVVVYAVCTKCPAVVNGNFCSQCGSAGKK